MVNAFRWMFFLIGLAVVIGSIMVTSAGNPIIVITSPSDGDTVDKDKITVSGGAKGTEGAIVKSVTVKGVPVEGTTSWSKDISLQPGLNQITVVAKDNMGQSSLKTISVTYNARTTTTISRGGYRNNNNNNGYINTSIPMPKGSISITTIPTGAERYLDNSGVLRGITPVTLENVPQGPHKVTVKKEGYHRGSEDIILGKTRNLKVILKPITGSISVYSRPCGASVYLDNVFQNKITPCVLSEVVVGQHTLKLTKSGCSNLIENVSVSVGKTTPLHVNLTNCRRYGSIDISSVPSGAKVYLDCNYTGKTPTNISMVVVGYHIIKLTKSGYEDAIIRNVSISVGGISHLNETLRECGYINISSDPPGAKVYLDCNYTGKTPTNISMVTQGNHTIKLTKSDYIDVIRNVSVSVGEIRHLHEILTGYGSLCISSNPPKAKVYLDNVYTGETALNISKVVEGTHIIKLTKLGYEDVEKMRPVPAGEQIVVDVTLSIPAWVRLLVEGGGNRCYICHYWLPL